MSVLLEMGGVALRSQTSCLLPPGRLHAPRRVVRRHSRSKLALLHFLRSVPVRLPHWGSLCKLFSVNVNFRLFVSSFGDGGSRTPVLMREIQASTGLVVYCIVGTGLAKRRAAGPYSGKSYPAVSEIGNRASPDCDAEAVPQSGGTVPRNYAAKA